MPSVDIKTWKRREHYELFRTFHSVLPWFRFRAFTNALPGSDSIPRIVFGKTTVERRRVTLPVAVEVHHALVDGLDVGRFLERFQTRLDGPLGEA